MSARRFITTAILALILGVSGPWIWFSYGQMGVLLMGMLLLLVAISQVGFKQLLVIASCLGLPAQYQTLAWLFDFQSQFPTASENYSSLFAIYGLVIFQQFLFATLLPACLTYLLVRRWQALPLLWAAPVIFTLFEAWRARAFTGFTLGQPGYGFIDTVWAGVLPAVGILGLTFVVWLLLTVIAQLILNWAAGWHRLGSPSYLVALALLACLPAANWWQWGQPTSTVPVRVVHDSAGFAMKDSLLGRQARQQQLQNLSADLKGAQLVFWPEGSVSPGGGLYGQTAEFSKHLQQQDAQLLFGGYNFLNQSEYNSILEGRSLQTVYRKRHLIPFGEYIPDSWITQFTGTALASLQHAQLQAGPELQADITAAGLQLRAMICFEIMFGHSLVNSDSDFDALLYFNDLSWVRDTLLLPQSLVMARARAMEYAKPLIAVSNMGISGYISPDGHVQQLENSSQMRAMDLVITTYQGHTLYARYGDRPLVVCLLLFLLASVWLAFRRLAELPTKNMDWNYVK